MEKSLNLWVEEMNRKYVPIDVSVKYYPRFQESIGVLKGILCE
jgi:hypothetical protein